MGAVKESEWPHPDESTELGRRGRLVMWAMGRQEFIDEVTEYEPGKRVAHRSESDSMVVHSSCAAEPEGNAGRATVTIQPERLPGGVFGALLAPIVRRKMRSDLKSDLARLKHLLEGDETR